MSADTVEIAATFDRRAIVDFLTHEALLLDERRFEEWRDLFADDGHYWVPLKPGQASPVREPSLFYNDKAAMEVRFERLRHPNIHSQTPPHRTCRIIGNVSVQIADAERCECVVTSNVMMVGYWIQTQRMFAGRVKHHLRQEGASFKIVLKRVDLINCDAVFELIAVPI